MILLYFLAVITSAMPVLQGMRCATRGVRTARVVVCRAARPAAVPARIAYTSASRPEPTWFKKAPRWLMTLGAGLCAADYLIDNGAHHDIVDVSRPSRIRPLGKILKAFDNHHGDNNDSKDESIDALATSLSKLQFEHDYPRIARAASTYKDQVSLALATNFSLLVPTMRNKLAQFAVMIAEREVHERDKGNITMCHGTAQGHAYLLNTIFDEVLCDAPEHESPKLRDDKIVKNAGNYPDAQTYYHKQKEEIYASCGQPTMQMKGGSAFGGTAGTESLYDPFHDGYSGMRDYFISANIGLFGHSTSKYGGLESSIEFMTLPYSLGKGYNYFVNPIAWMGLLAAFRYESKQPLKQQIRAAMDNCSKTSASMDALPKMIFKAYGCQDQYATYAEELAAMQTVARAGMIQFSLPEAIANRWCYASKRRGIMATQKPLSKTIADPKAFPEYQARIFMHPEVINSKIKFYLAGDPVEIEAMIERIYEIAHEIKNSHGA